MSVYDFAGRHSARAHSGTAFAQADTIDYAYNAKSELTNAVASVDSNYTYAYDFDEIGNRKTSSECGVRSAVYVANELNQYTAINTDASALSEAPCETFTPLFDADGNQTLVKTATGTWQVSYNGENRPILRTCGETNIVMSYDRMGRRVTKSAECGVQSAECCCFVYDGYLQIANHCTTTTTSNYNYQSTPTPSTYTSFIWDPTEPVATRPLVWFNSALDTPHSALYYTHDGNKNVSEVIEDNGDIAAHYEYAPFGAVTAQSGESAAANPWRFSSEFADDELGCDFYNYREYEPMTGRWMSRDLIGEEGGLNLYSFSRNSLLNGFESLGLKWRIVRNGDDFADACATTKVDTFTSLAMLLKMDREDVTKWAHTSDPEAVKGKFYRIPNLIVFQESVRTAAEARSSHVFSEWARLNARMMSIYRAANFKVVHERDVALSATVLTALGRDGLYKYTYTGHGTDDWGLRKGYEGGNLALDPESLGVGKSSAEEVGIVDTTTVILDAKRYTVYGISSMELQACNSGNVNARANWAKNVAKNGRFIGYEGPVNNNPFANAYYIRHEVSIAGTNGH